MVGALDKQPARERARKRMVGIMKVRGMSLMNLNAAVGEKKGGVSTILDGGRGKGKGKTYAQLGF